MACDLCGRTGTHLVDLRDEYKVDGIAAMCSECERVVNRENMRAWALASRLRIRITKRYLLKRRATIAPPPAPLRTSAFGRDTLSLGWRDMLQLLLHGRMRIERTALQLQLWRRFEGEQ